MASRKLGRAKGSRNKGYFFRAARGWFAKDAAERMIPLTTEDGERLKDEHTPKEAVEEAYDRFKLARKQTAVVAGSGMLLSDLCQHYLAHVEAAGAAATLKLRADCLFDLCFGLPAKWRDSKAKASAKDKLHPGFGNVPAEKLEPAHILTWLAAHKGWKSGARRIRIQAIKRCLNYGIELRLIERHLLRGFKVPRPGARVCEISPEQETALLETAGFHLRLAIRVLLRTGMRPGEFVRLTAGHVRDLGEKMELHFRPEEVKTRKARVVRIMDSTIIELIRKQVAHYKRGPLFRNQADKGWAVKSLSRAFTRAKHRAEKAGLEFDRDACLYSLRHTFAKRVLNGHWSGRPVSVEMLSRLMGNSPQVCRDSYLKWSDAYEAPLWEAVS